MAEIKAYTVAIGNISPFNKKSRDALKHIKKLEGLYGVHPLYPKGNLLLFKTENDAKRGRNELKAKGIQCGVNICEVYIRSQSREEAEKALRKGGAE